MEQAFYFVGNIDISDYGTLSTGNMIRAYNDNILVGERYWNGSYTDIPAMGNDGSLETAGYCEQNDEIKFTITLDDGREYALSGNIPNWSSNEIYTIENLQIDTSQSVPSDIAIIGSFPNPFNPSTVISYEIHKNSDINVSIYNLNGQLISELYNGYQDAGYYELNFNAEGLSSGMYFVRINNNFEVHTQKILLMK